MCFTPLIDEICSSIGSRISFSTPSGDAPGYGMPTVTTGGATSGNSSVLSFSSANRPNTTSVTIETTVMSGFLIAKSEMNMGESREGLLRCLLPGVGRRGDLHRGARRDPARCAEQQGVACRDAGRDLDRLRRLIADAEADLHLLDLAVLEAHHRRPQAALVHRAQRHHRRDTCLARHPPLGEQSTDERVPRVG